MVPGGHAQPHERSAQQVSWPAGGTGHSVPDLRRMVLPAVRSGYRAIESYRCPPDAAPLTVPITVLVGDGDPRVTVEEAGAGALHIDAGTDVHVFPGGDHFYLNEFRETVAELVRLRLGVSAQ
ncbi:thioesterase II family protein [Streptomyces sp. 3213.3]|uniref:thioesterase II family protein n=1 Tax=Streptomyces sp. 3213.3 TaxID=1855348 RepID=UPI0022869C15|nr:thioesterase domain-containing protein [Streptomyces sp. 3213.3]